MPQPPERRVSKSTAIAGMVSLPASDPQPPAPAAKARGEESSLARATPAAIKDDQSGHRSNCGLTTKTPLRRSEAGAEQSSLSRDTRGGSAGGQPACVTDAGSPTWCDLVAAAPGTS